MLKGIPADMQIRILSQQLIEARRELKQLKKTNEAVITYCQSLEQQITQQKKKYKQLKYSGLASNGTLYYKVIVSDDEMYVFLLTSFDKRRRSPTTLPSHFSSFEKEEERYFVFIRRTRNVDGAASTSSTSNRESPSPDTSTS